jgi:hypothetical protein
MYNKIIDKLEILAPPQKIMVPGWNYKINRQQSGSHSKTGPGRKPLSAASFRPKGSETKILRLPGAKPVPSRRRFFCPLAGLGRAGNKAWP